MYNWIFLKRTLNTCNWLASVEYKKARQEIKKAASDTMRLQKKVKKGQGGSLKENLFFIVMTYVAHSCVNAWFMYTYLFRAPAGLE